MRKPLLLVLAAAALTVALPATSAMGAKTLKVGLYDNYFKPEKKTIVKGRKVKWTWKGALNHNLTLVKAPKGIDKDDYSTDPDGQVDGSFSRRLKKVGKWRFVCTLHQDMEQLIKVVRPD